MSMPTFWPAPNSFLESLQGKVTPQAFMWATLPCAEVVEMAGALGLDCVVVDMEHGCTGLDQAQALITAAQGSGMTALVRVDSPEADVTRVLDIGAQGVVFPHVQTAEQAARARAGMNYPPSGTRGWSGAHSRAVRWTGTTTAGGSHPDLLSPAYLEAANDSLVRIFMIEDRSGVDQIEEILDQGAPHGVIFGWGDLTVEVCFDAELVARARSRVLEACRQRGIGVAISVVPPDGTAYYPGCFYSAGVDSTLLSSALLGRLEAVRQATTDRAPDSKPNPSRS